MTTLPLPANNSRIGYHYYPDTVHYRQHDVQHWLPILKSLNTSWLFLQSSVDRAIPETFISELVGQGIEPVIQFPISPSNPPNSRDFSLLLDSYEKWGVHYVILFDRPNMRSSWSSAAWSQQDLVERFLDRYIPLATQVIESGLTPVFPPLEPGGDYWDTTFLKSALKSLQRRSATSIMDNLVLSAYAPINEKGLNWGAGGPERWPGARPYMKSESNEDQKGFHIFDWYTAISKSVTGSELPIFLMGVGAPDGSLNGQKSSSQYMDLSIQAQHVLSIYQLLNREKVNEPGKVEKSLEPVPDMVLGCGLWLLCADVTSPYAKTALFQSETQPGPVIQVLQNWLETREKTAKSVPTPTDDHEHPIAHYLLLPTYEWGISGWHLDIARPFILKHSPTIGFSVSEAAHAVQVTVVGGPQTFSEETLKYLRDQGCTVERISGDGTTIASLMAER